MPHRITVGVSVFSWAVPWADTRLPADQRPHPNVVRPCALSAFADLRVEWARHSVRGSGSTRVPPLCAGPRSGPDIAGVRARTAHQEMIVTAYAATHTLKGCSFLPDDSVAIQPGHG
ncbi:hypothetical protein D9M70_198960 [compost metagenome]